MSLAVVTASDGCALEAELALPGGGEVRGAMVLCHPHPLQGGTMRSIVIGALFGALPADGVACLRFNYRGVGDSTGEYASGFGEQLDVLAAVDALSAELDPAVPLVVGGWSFGADMALLTMSDRVAGWFAVAPPLRYGDGFHASAADPRPKHLVLAEHDETRDPATVVEECASWTSTTIDVIGGASHYFVGRTDRVVSAALSFVERVRPG